MQLSLSTTLVGSALLFALASGGAVADSSATHARSVTQLADGVYAIRHADAPDGYPQGNTTVVIGQRAVLVIDSGYLPSTAREDIAQIRRWAQQPVRYVLNTHWHPDHQRGNAAYLDAYPHAEVIAHANTLQLMNAYEPGNLARYPTRLATFEETVAKGVDAAGAPLTAEQLRDMREQLAGRKRVLAELQSSRMQVPTLTFDRELNLDLGGRVVQIRHSGVGDTQGDAWAYLPQERILIAGDLLAAPVPYFFAGFPAGVAHSLGELLDMDPQTIVPGHGDVLHGQTYLRDVLALVQKVIAEVNAAVARAGSLSAKLEDVRQQIDVTEFRQRFAGADEASQQYFDESIDGLIRNAFNQAPK